jgi:hypothetical protein
VTTCLVGAALAGCQLFVPSGEAQCKSDGDCGTRGTDFAGSVCVDELCVLPGDRCLGKVPDAPEDRSKPLHTRMRVVNVGGLPLAGVPLLVCAVLDEKCESPTSPPVLTDAAGYAYLTIWKNFRGTVQIKNPPATADYFKLKVHFLGAFEVDDKPDRVIPPDGAVHLLTRTLFNLQLGSRGPVDAAAGHVIAQTLDCDLKPRAGVRIALTSEASTGAPLPFYFTDDQLISTTATETGARGLFGVVNVPEGPIVVVADIPASGRALGSVRLWVNRDTLSNFAVAPTPSP